MVKLGEDTNHELPTSKRCIHSYGSSQLNAKDAVCIEKRLSKLGRKPVIFSVE